MGYLEDKFIMLISTYIINDSTSVILNSCYKINFVRQIVCY